MRWKASWAVRALTGLAGKALFLAGCALTLPARLLRRVQGAADFPATWMSSSVRRTSLPATEYRTPTGENPLPATSICTATCIQPLLATTIRTSVCRTSLPGSHPNTSGRERDRLSRKGSTRPSAVSRILRTDPFQLLQSVSTVDRAPRLGGATRLTTSRATSFQTPPPRRCRPVPFSTSEREERQRGGAPGPALPVSTSPVRR